MVAIVALTVTSIAHAGLITTTFAGGNNYAGNMFDVTTFDNSLTITSADLHLQDSGTSALVSIYTRVGGYAGFEADSSAWTLQDQASVISAGDGNATLFDFADFNLNSNTTYGFYFTVTDYAVRMNYTNGNNVYSNADLQITTGIGRGENDFAGNVFNPRTWNGTLHYNTTSIPEPASYGIFALGLIGLVLRKRNKA